VGLKLERKDEPNNKGVEMTDNQMYKELEKFANSHTLAKDIKVTITAGGKRFEATNKEGGKYEDVCLLSNIVLGAEHYLMWKRRKQD